MKLCLALKPLLNSPRRLHQALIVAFCLLLTAFTVLSQYPTLTIVLSLFCGVLLGFVACLQILSSVLPQAKEDNFLEKFKNEQRLAQNLLQQYQSLTSNLAASVIIRDIAGKITYCSPYTEVLTGYALSEIEGFVDDFFLSISHEEDREKLVRALKISSDGEPFQFRCRYFHKSGIEMWYETRTVPVLAEDGNLLFSLSVTIDVTANVRVQKQLEERNKDLQDFTYMASHDLKAPIYTLKGMVGILREDLGTGLSSDAIDSLHHIEHATERLNQLVTSILEYSRVSIQETKAESVDLNLVLADVLNDYALQGEKAQASIKVAKDLPQVVGERIKIYQIFSNLVGNAIKYRDQSRPLVIEVFEKPCRFSRSAIISVKDSGTGIATEKLPALFRPFQRGATHVEGMGIGLACVKKLTEKLGGKIDAISEVGKGSEFVLTLRRAQ